MNTIIASIQHEGSGRQEPECTWSVRIYKGAGGKLIVNIRIHNCSVASSQYLDERRFAWCPSRFVPLGHHATITGIRDGAGFPNRYNKCKVQSAPGLISWDLRRQLSREAHTFAVIVHQLATSNSGFMC